MLHQAEHSKILHFAYKVHLFVLILSHKKTVIILYTALTDWFYNRDGMILLRGTN
jgi:hypothetical protein